MENNSLIPIKENIFKKVFNFFKGLFFKKELLIIQPEENIEEVALETSENTEIDFNQKSIIEETADSVMSENDENDLFKQFAKVGYVYEEHEFVDDINPEEDKKEFFKLYENVKNKIISIKDLNGIDLIKINQMIKNEVNIKQNKLN